MSMIASFERTCLLSVLALATVASACGGDSKGGKPPAQLDGGTSGDDDGDDDDGADDDTGGGGELSLVFSPMYSGYDGVHEYKVPVIVEGIKNATFTASDPSMVDIQKTAEGAMITTRKAGKVTITAKAGGLRGTSELTITQFTPAEWEAGKQRYTMGQALVLPTFDPCKPIVTPPTISNELSCTNCHGTTASFGDIEHTPQQTGGYSDDELVTIFTQAKKPAGIGMHTMIPQQIWQFFHKWKVDETQKKGVVAYLRALPPKAQGALDFNGLRGDGGFVRPTCDGGVPAGDAGVRLDGGT